MSTVPQYDPRNPTFQSPLNPHQRAIIFLFYIVEDDMETLGATWKYVMEFKTHGWIPLREDEDFNVKDFDPNFFFERDL